MVYDPALRKASKEQFAEGCSIDGLRVDKAMEEIVHRHNHIRRGDLKTRYVRQTYSWGWEPPTEDGAITETEDRPATKMPFIRSHNSERDVYGSPSPPDDYATNGENPWRNKGFDVTTINPEQDPDPTVTVTHDQYVWTTAIAFSQPVVLDSIYLLLAVDDTYSNNFKYPNPAGPGLISPATQITDQEDYITDLVVQMQADSSLGYNNATLSDLMVNKWNFRADSALFRQYTPIGVDMFPNTIINFPDGIVVHLKDLNVPLPSNSRVRFSVIIPYYNPATYNVAGSWNVGSRGDSWARQVYHASSTFLHEVR